MTLPPYLGPAVVPPSGPGPPWPGPALSGVMPGRRSMAGRPTPRRSGRRRRPSRGWPPSRLSCSGTGSLAPRPGR